MWITLARIAFSVLITAVGKVPPEQWAKLGAVIATWLQKMEDSLPAGNPLIAIMNSYRAPRLKLIDHA